MSDEEAIRRVLAGDADAFGVLHERYDPMVRSRLFRTVPDSSAVEEMDQRTWIAAYKKLPGFKGRSRFSTWLYRIARNEALWYRRDGRSRARPISLDGMEPGTEPSVSGPEEEYERGQRREQLERNLARLPRAQRTAVWLKFWEDRTYEEIAQMTGRKTTTLASDVHRGLERLRRDWR